MSEYSSLKATINANIKANNNHEITGAITNSVLNAMVNALGAGYQFIGVATPTNPGTAQTPDYKCFYLATTPGTYTNLGGLVVADGEVALLKWDTTWTKEVTGIASADKLNQLGQQVEEIYISCAPAAKIDFIFNNDGGFTVRSHGVIYVFGNSQRRNVLTYTTEDITNTFSGQLSSGFLYIHRLSINNFEYAFREYTEPELSVEDGYYYLGFVDFPNKKVSVSPWYITLNSHIKDYLDGDSENYPQNNSEKLVRSKGIFNAFAAKFGFFSGVTFTFTFVSDSAWKLALANRGNNYPSFLSFNGMTIPLPSVFFTEILFSDTSFGWLFFDFSNKTFVYSNYTNYQTYVNSGNYFLVAACNPYFGEIIPYAIAQENLIISCDINRLLKIQDDVKLSACDYLVKTPIVLNAGKSIRGSFGKTRLLLSDGCTTCITASNANDISISDLEIVGTCPDYQYEMNGIIAGAGYDIITQLSDVYVTYPGEQKGPQIRSTPHITTLGDEKGIYLYYCENIVLNNIKINHIDGSAIRCNHVGMNYIKGLNASNLFISNCVNGIWTENEHEFSNYSNFRISLCQVGLLISSGNLNFSGGSITRGIIGIALLDGYNQAHGVIGDMEIAHNQIAGIYAKDIIVGETFGNMNMGYSKLILQDSCGIIFNSLFSVNGNAPIICSYSASDDKKNYISVVQNIGALVPTEIGNTIIGKSLRI